MNTKMNTNNKPTLSFYHANAKGTGAAVRFALVPAQGWSDGHIIMDIANQIGSAGANGIRFDFNNRITIKLDFVNLCQMLQVFRGETESISDGKGLYYTDTREQKRVFLRHIIEPVCGYQLQVYSTDRATNNQVWTSILFNQYEALGLCEAIAGSLSVIAFGLPLVVTSATSDINRLIEMA